jgi:two-component system chemotaxis sensor kinase CheA
MAIDMTQFYQVFFEESAEHLAAMETLLLELDIENPDSEQLNAIFRAAHSIKGSAGTFGFNDLAETTHILENLLDRIRKQELALRADMVDAFLECGDRLREMLEGHQGRGAVDPAAVENICARLRQLSSDDAPAAAAVIVPPAVTALQPVAPLQSAIDDEVAVRPPLPDNGKRVYDIQFVPTQASAKSEGVANLLDELRSIGHLEVVVHPDSDDSSGFWELRLITDVAQDVFSDQIDFISDNGAWRINEDTSVAVDGTEAFGFLANHRACRTMSAAMVFSISWKKRLPSYRPPQRRMATAFSNRFRSKLPARQNRLRWLKRVMVTDFLILCRFWPPALYLSRC